MLPGEGQSREGRIAWAVTSGAAARVLSAGVSLLTLPLAVRYLGAERFGIWATVSSTVLFLNLLDLGIAATLTNRIARAYATGDRVYAVRYVSNAIALSASIAGGAALALMALWNRIDIPRLLSVPVTVPDREVDATIVVAVALVLIGIPASLAGRIFAGYQEVHRGNAVVAAATVANFAALLIGIGLHASMPTLFALGFGWTAALNLGALVVLVCHSKPWLRPRLSLLRWSDARELLGSGSGFFLVQLAGVVVFSTDNVILSHYLGPAQVTPYNVTWRLAGFAAFAQGLLFPALWPAYAEAYARRDLEWMRRAFAVTMRGTLALTAMFAVVLVLAGQALVRWWAGSTAVPSRTLLAAMAVWAVISGCMTVESCLLAGTNRTHEQGVLSIAAALVNLGLSIFLVQRIGAVGVILGTILSYLLVLVVPQSLLVRRALRLQRERPGGEMYAVRTADGQS
jgi:O-antigen/teichoic acid export membrane protein